MRAHGHFTQACTVGFGALRGLWVSGALYLKPNLGLGAGELAGTADSHAKSRSWLSSEASNDNSYCRCLDNCQDHSEVYVGYLIPWILVGMYDHNMGSS